MMETIPSHPAVTVAVAVAVAVTVATKPKLHHNVIRGVVVKTVGA